MKPALLAAIALVAPVYGQGSLDTIALSSLGYFACADEVTPGGNVVIGTEQLLTNESQPFLWTKAGRVDLPNGPMNNAGLSGISADGRIICGSLRLLTGGFGPCIWVDGIGPQALPLTTGATVGSARAISADGSLIAGASGDLLTIWEGGIPTGYPLPAGFSGSTVQGMSASGEYVAGDLSIPSSTLSRAFLWSQANGFQLLATPAGGKSTVRDISADGTLVVGTVTQNGSNLPQAAVWNDPDNLMLVGDPNWPSSIANSTSSDGSRVLLQGNTTLPGFPQSYILDTGAGSLTPVVDLLAQAGGPTIPIQGLLEPHRISDDGQTVLGWAFPVPGSNVSPPWVAGLNQFGTPFCGPSALTSTGSNSSLLGSGSLSIAGGGAELTATLLPPHSVGLFLASRLPANVTPAGSQGVLCLGDPIGRFSGPGQFLSSGADGTFRMSIDLQALPTPSGRVAAIPGETWYFQAWFRDVNPLPTSNFTNGLSAVLSQ